MANEAGNAYGLTTLCPIRRGSNGKESFASLTRAYLQLVQELERDEKSPMAKVPDTYLCRFFVLTSVAYQGKPATLDGLKSAYLVFIAELHGDRDAYLRGLWTHARAFVDEVWTHCVGFQHVDSADDFVRYINDCQVTTTLYFAGSTDDSLAEQLKALYLKQEFSQFAFASARKSSEQLQKDFHEFVERTRPLDLSGPTWRAGASRLEDAVVDGGEKP
jgi:hypothetical protein